MSNIAVRKTGAVMVDLDALNYDLAGKAIDRILAKTGGGAFKRNFPGTQHAFKKGEYVEGYGKNAKTHGDMEWVVNVPHMMTGYVKFAENDEGKTIPNYTPPCLPMAGMDMPDRESLGDLDEDEWDEYQGKQVDPWKVYVVLPIREKDESEVHHFMATSPSHNRVLYNFFKECLETMKLKPGMLPVVSFGSAKAKMEKKTTDKRGKEKVEKLTWDVPQLTVKSWVKVEDCDRLNAAVDMGEEGGGDVGEVETVARTPAKSSPKAKSAAAPVQKTTATQKSKPAPAGKTKRKVSDDEI